MSDVDISHLPSPDELQGGSPPDISGLPSPDQIQVKPGFTPPTQVPDKEEEPQYSELESAGLGVAQGATLGYADELEGAVKALGAKGEALVKGEDQKDLKSLYKQYRDIARKRYKAAEEQNPKSFMAGNIAGGIATTAATGGAGAGVGTLGALGAISGLGASQADLSPIVGGELPSAENAKSAFIDTGIGGGIGLLAGAAGKGVQKLLTPQELETAASKVASKAVGIKPSKELNTIWERQGDHWVKKEGTDIIKGIGQTAMDEGALPMTGGADNIYNKTLDAINVNEAKLKPIFQKVQNEVDKDVLGTLDKVGQIAPKSEQFMDDFLQTYSKDPDYTKIAKNIKDKYQPYISEMAQADGNLAALNEFKQALQKKAEDLSSQAFNTASSDLGAEAAFVKRLSGVVKGHIEDIANAVDEGSGQAIADTNKTLSNLYTWKQGAKSLLDKSPSAIQDIASTGTGIGLGAAAAGGPGALAAVVAKKGIEVATGHPIGKAAQIATAKTFNAASKALKTPLGQLAQKALPTAVKGAMVSPFTPGAVQGTLNPQDEEAPAENVQAVNNATVRSANLYNASDDSLKQIAEQLKKEPGINSYGDNLSKALESGNPQDKNNAIFLILQNPRSRKLVTPEGK